MTVNANVGLIITVVIFSIIFVWMFGLMALGVILHNPKLVKMSGFGSIGPAALLKSYCAKSASPETLEAVETIKGNLKYLTDARMAQIKVNRLNRKAAKVNQQIDNYNNKYGQNAMANMGNMASQMAAQAAQAAQAAVQQYAPAPGSAPGSAYQSAPGSQTTSSSQVFVNGKDYSQQVPPGSTYSQQIRTYGGYEEPARAPNTYPPLVMP